MLDSKNKESVLASLQLSAQKWGIFYIDDGGDKEYCKLCVELAAEHGLKIGNPELQQALQKERAKLKNKGKQPLSRTVKNVSIFFSRQIILN